MYSYCPPWALSWAYRKQNLLRELLGYKADIMCLQEVRTPLHCTLHYSIVPTVALHCLSLVRGFKADIMCLHEVPRAPLHCSP